MRPPNRPNDAPTEEVGLTTTTMIALATADIDYGHVAADRAEAEAQGLANEEGKPVTLRDPITDQVLATIKPARDATDSQGRP